jgi:hypothetical protein
LDPTGSSEDKLSLWVNYSCILKTASLGLTWVGSQTFDIAVSNVKISNEDKYQCKWQFYENQIESFKSTCDRRELQQFEEAFNLLPEYVIFYMKVVL